MTSPVIRDGNSEDLSGVPGAQTAGAEGRDGAVNPTLGVDPRTDPELYMALQISFMEEQERQARVVFPLCRSILIQKKHTFLFVTHLPNVFFSLLFVLGCCSV